MKGKPLKERVLSYFLFFSFYSIKPFFSSLYNSWSLTYWSDLLDLKNQEGGRKDGTENGGSREVYQQTRKMEFENESGNYGVEGKHAGPERNKRNVAGHQEGDIMSEG